MSSTPVKVTEGYVPFVREGKTYQTYYKIFGDLENRTRTPVVGVHGGPGLVHDYLVALADLTRDAAFPVILYDQLGNGRSSRVPAARAGFWSVALFLDELENLLAALGARGAFARAALADVRVVRGLGFGRREERRRRGGRGGWVGKREVSRGLGWGRECPWN